VGIKLAALPQMYVVAQQNTVTDLHSIQTHYYYYYYYYYLLLLLFLLLLL